MALDLKKKKLFLFDLDGTVYKENDLFNGALNLFQYINEIGGYYVFLTNNSSKSIEEYIIKLTKFGVTVTSNNFFTSTMATAFYLNENHYQKKIFCIGTNSFRNELLSYGVKVTIDMNQNPEVVLVAFDTELTYDKILVGCELLFNDKPFIATNPDKCCPVNFGCIPDCGAICDMLTAATGRSPIYLGKPDPIMIDWVLNKFKYTKEEAIIIGDRLYTDIACGINAGITTVCLLTGETKIEDIKSSIFKPDLIYSDISNFYKSIVSDFNYKSEL